jgi:hypothetical protein
LAGEGGEEVSDSEIIENSISSQGMRWAHVIRMGEPVDREAWVAQVPWYSLAGVETNAWVEPGVGIHHLKIWWMAREPVKLFKAAGVPDGTLVLFWAMDKGQSIREAAVLAGVAYLDYFGRWPNLVRFAKLPEGATERIEIYNGADELVTARLVETSWAPKGFLIMEAIDE